MGENSRGDNDVDADLFVGVFGSSIAGGKFRPVLGGGKKPRGVYTGPERARALAEWHELLLEHLTDTEGSLRDRIVNHAALK